MCVYQPIKMSAIILNAFLSLGLLSRLKYAIIKFREVKDRVSVTVRADRIIDG